MKPKDEDEPFEPGPKDFPPEPTYPPWKDPKPKEVPGGGWKEAIHPEEGQHPEIPGDEVRKRACPNSRSPGITPISLRPSPMTVCRRTGRTPKTRRPSEAVDQINSDCTRVPIEFVKENDDGRR
ncbi:hypothetical protein GCM10023325_09710 [Sphingomonas lutea]